MAKTERDPDTLAHDRERYTVSAGPLLSFLSAGCVRKAADAALRPLRVDH